MMHRALPVFLALIASSLAGQVVTTIEPATPARGTPVIMTFAGDTDAVPGAVRLYRPAKSRDEKREAAAEVSLLRASEDKPQFRFFIPDYLAFGVYDIALPQEAGEDAGATAAAPPDLFVGRVRVTLPAAPKITGISPGVLYPDDARTITIIGDFSAQASEHALVLNGHLIPPCSGKLVAGVDCVTVESALEGRGLTFSKIPVTGYGTQNVQLTVDQQQAIAEQSLLFPRAQRTTPRTLAIGASVLVLLVVFLPLLLVAVPDRSWLGRMATAGRGLFLDTQTNTYSLSKIQLYLWLLAAVFGWVYLTSCLSLVQGRLAFAALPKNMPGILLFSLGTTTIASGVSRARPKGAGSSKPSVTDLVTSGGVVIPERVQYLVWTILGFLAFVLLVLSTDPSTIKELPTVPEEFLYVMGLSSAGYLGGKLARQPGPILSGGSVSPGSVTLTVCGTNLAANATLSINGAHLQPSWMAKMQGETLAPEDDARYAKQLRFHLPRASMQITDDAPAVMYLPDKQKVAGPFTLRLVNPDGQAAEYELIVDTDAAPEPAPAENWMPLELTDPERILQWESDIPEWVRRLKRHGVTRSDLDVLRDAARSRSADARLDTLFNRAQLLWASVD